MTPLYSEKLRACLNKTLARSLISGGVLLVVVVAIELALLVGEIILAHTIVGAAVLVFGIVLEYILLQKRILPCFYAIRLMEKTDKKESTQIQGSFLGFEDVLGFRDRVLMRRIRIDVGLKFRQEDVITELMLPVCIEKPDIAIGTKITAESVENIITACELPGQNWNSRISLRQAGYRCSPLICGLILLAGSLLWGTIFASVNQHAPEHELNVAVCIEIYSSNFTEGLESAMSQYGIQNTNINYSNTNDGEQSAIFLATYGALEADILLMDAWSFEGAFKNEGYRFLQEELDTLNQLAAATLKYVYDDEGFATGLILYDPEDHLYSESFSWIHRWLKLKDDTCFIIAINASSDHISDGTSMAVVEYLLSQK